MLWNKCNGKIELVEKYFIILFEYVEQQYSEKQNKLANENMRRIDLEF